MNYFVICNQKDCESIRQYSGMSKETIEALLKDLGIEKYKFIEKPEYAEKVRIIQNDKI